MEGFPYQVTEEEIRKSVKNILQKLLLSISIDMCSIYDKTIHVTSYLQCYNTSYLLATDPTDWDYYVSHTRA